MDMGGTVTATGLYSPQSCGILTAVWDVSDMTLGDRATCLGWVLRMDPRVAGKSSGSGTRSPGFILGTLRPVTSPLCNSPSAPMSVKGRHYLTTQVSREE